MTCLGQAGIQAFLSPGNQILYGLSFALKFTNSQEAALLCSVIALNVIILSFSRIAQNQLSWKNLNFIFVKENLNIRLEKEKQLDGVM